MHTTKVYIFKDLQCNFEVRSSNFSVNYKITINIYVYINSYG